MKTCKDYEMDLMHKASGEVERINDKEALEEHLKGCQVCQKVMAEFLEVDTFAAVTREPSKGFQDKIADLRQRSQKGLPPPIDTEKVVGLAAVQIYQYLKDNGPATIPVLRQHTGLINYPFYEAMGWLNHENKIIVRGEPGQPQYAELK